MTEVVNIQDFLMTNVDTTDQKREVKFNRYKSPFVIKALGAEENSQLQKQATKRVQDRKTHQTISQMDQDKYVDLLMEASVVTPDLNSEELQKSWGCLADPSGLLKKMLLAGEYAELANQIQDLSGFEAEDIDNLVDQAKN